MVKLKCEININRFKVHHSLVCIFIGPKPVEIVTYSNTDNFRFFTRFLFVIFFNSISLNTDFNAHSVWSLCSRNKETKSETAMNIPLKIIYFIPWLKKITSNWFFYLLFQLAYLLVWLKKIQTINIIRCNDIISVRSIFHHCI